jgi:hypothetical protein
MLQSAGCDGFDPKTTDHRLARHRTEEQHFDRHNSIQTLLPGLIDDSHSALGDLLQKFVITKRPGRSELSRSITGSTFAGRIPAFGIV